MTYDITKLHPTPAGWIRRSGIPERYRGLTMADIDTAVAYVGGKKIAIKDSPVQDWLEGVRRDGLSYDNARGLLLSGTPGTGKTRLMAILLQEVARTVPTAHLGHSPESLLATPVGFSTFAGLIENRKRMFNVPSDSDEWARLDHKVEIFNATAGGEWDVRVAGIDDVGKEHTTSSRFAEDSFDYLLRHRFDKGYPTLVTSNLRRDDWGIYGDSMVSFAHEALTEVVIMNKKGDGRR
jgi:hypothetical protein